MKLSRSNTSIDATLWLGTSLLEEAPLQRVQEILGQFAPEWSSKLHLWRGGEPQARSPIDIGRQNGILDLMLTKGIAKGELFERLNRLAPVPNPERRLGSMELRGAYPGLTVVLDSDDWLFCPMGTEWHVGNHIALQVRNKRIEERPSCEWIEECFSVCCTKLGPLFGFACAAEEYAAKNICTEGGGLRTIGTDIAKYLPGVYWLNFFGAPYGNLIGEKRLAATAAHRVSSCGSGYLVQLGPDPEDWNSDGYRDREESVRRHLGEEYFFIRDREQRKTASPFDLPRLSPRGKIEADVELQSGSPVVTQIRLKGFSD